MFNIKGFGSFLLYVILFFTLLPVLPQTLQAQQEGFTISGMVLSSSGRGIDGVQIGFFDGEISDYVYTDGGGHYSYYVYPEWSGTVTPYDPCYTFSPGSVTIEPLLENKTQNFTATIHTLTISGIASDGSSPIPGVLLTLSTGGTKVSGYDGSYSFTVTCGWTGTVTPLKAGWLFSPLFINYPEPFFENQTNQDYIGTASGTQFSISGQVTDQSGRIGMDGVAIAFYDGITEQTETTAGGGYYSHTVPIFWAGTVTPTLSGYSFTPAYAAMGPVQSDINRNFVGTTCTYTISGTAVDNKGNPIADVTITRSTGGSTNTNSSGYYEFQVAHGWTANLTPSKTGWKFNPVYRSYNNVATDLNNEYFFGVELKDQYSISGTVTAGGTAISGVVLNGLPGNPVTDTSGFYSAPVTKGWSGTVTPALSGYSFTPTSRTYADVKDNFVNENYEAAVNDAPQVTIVTPQDKAFVNGEIIIKVESSDNDGIDKVEIYIDDQKAAEYQNLQAQTAKMDPADLSRVFENNHYGLQSDNQGNNYALVPEKEGKIALVKYSGAARSEILLEGDIQVSGWLVKPDGTVFIAGISAGTGENWIKSLIPDTGLPGLSIAGIDIKWNVNLAGSENEKIDFADLLATTSNTTFTCKYIWDTSLYDLGSHEITAKAYDTKGMSAENRIDVTISTLTMQLQLERKLEKAWIIEKEYVNIAATIENPNSIPIAKYMIYRKSAGSEFTIIYEVPASQVQGNSFAYTDRTIENNIRYTYKAAALDENGIILCTSDEKTI